MEGRTVPSLDLRPYQPDAGDTLHTVTAVAERFDEAGLSLTYRIVGAVDAIAWPEPAPHEFADLLWQHTCFEVFVGAEGEAWYREFNLSPSSRFAAYAFDGHRTGMRRADDAVVVEQHFSRSAACAEMRAVVRLDGLADAACWEVGLTTVIEERSGTKSFWALAHPDGAADFHDRDCFIARLPAPEHS
jgi:hypothetical protein